jgi:hypothetical protein
MKVQKDHLSEYRSAPAHPELAPQTAAPSSTNLQLNVWEGEGGAVAAPVIPYPLLRPLLAKCPAEPTRGTMHLPAEGQRRPPTGRAQLRGTAKRVKR